MPSITIPVRMTTAMLFFVAGGIAAYFAIDKPDIEWFVRACFLFFGALGPVYWIQELVLELPWKDDGRYTEGSRLDDTLVGKVVMWAFNIIRAVLILWACRLVYLALFAL